eukprot:GHVP01001115.1.p1 GENE.GHVP01001115.1~~GHVP01001115.1.p1  ORF type:complete len:100 (-),score=5.02 GHVP01001115.1:533-832(-)
MNPADLQRVLKINRTTQHIRFGKQMQSFRTLLEHGICSSAYVRCLSPINRVVSLKGNLDFDIMSTKFLIVKHRAPIAHLYWLMKGQSKNFGISRRRKLL